MEYNLRGGRRVVVWLTPEIRGIIFTLENTTECPHSDILWEDLPRYGGSKGSAGAAFTNLVGVREEKITLKPPAIIPLNILEEWGGGHIIIFLWTGICQSQTLEDMPMGSAHPFSFPLGSGQRYI